MVNVRARIGGLEHGSPRLAACKEVCFDCLTRITALQNWRGSDAHASSPPAPTPNKTKLQKWAAGCPAPSNGPPAKKSQLPCQHPPASTTGRAKRGRPTRPSRNFHSFLLHLQRCRRHRVEGLWTTFECCTSRDQVAVSAAPRDCTLLPPFPCLRFLSPSTSRYPARHTTRAPDESACPCDEATRQPRWTTSTSTSTRRSSST